MQIWGIRYTFFQCTGLQECSADVDGAIDLAVENEEFSHGIFTTTQPREPYVLCEVA